MPILLIFSQVIRNSVALALQEKGRHDTDSMVKFLKIFNRTFDCLNVSNLHGKTKDLQPYCTVDDPRFQVFILTTFLYS